MSRTCVFPGNLAKMLPQALEVAGRPWRASPSSQEPLDARGYRELERWEVLNQCPSWVRHRILRQEPGCYGRFGAPLFTSGTGRTPFDTIYRLLSQQSIGTVLCHARHISHLGEIKATSLRIQCE
jgi:hypothetical protein